MLDDSVWQLATLAVRARREACSGTAADDPCAEFIKEGTKKPK